MDHLLSLRNQGQTNNISKEMKMFVSKSTPFSKKTSMNMKNELELTSPKFHIPGKQPGMDMFMPKMISLTNSSTQLHKKLSLMVTDKVKESMTEGT